MIPLFKVNMSEHASAMVSDVLNSGYIGQGEKVEEFERLLKVRLMTPHCVTVNSCTSALHLALHMIKELPGDEVITTPLTCTATNFAILANNYKVKWADVSLKDCNICLDDVERKLSPNTKAIMVVHWGGQPVDLDRLKQIQEKCQSLYGHTPPVIEDCAHAWGSMYKGRHIGTHGNYCAFSFQAIKHLTTGDGGLLVCPDEATYKRAKLLRWFGLDRESTADFRCSQNVADWGFKFHMNDINASIGIANFVTTDYIVHQHRTNACFYDKELQNVPGLTLLTETGTSAAWIYTIRVNNRDGFKKKMIEAGIHVSQVHSRNDVFDCMKDCVTPLPNMDILGNDMIAIPCGWWVSKEDRQKVVDTIRSGW